LIAHSACPNPTYPWVLTGWIRFSDTSCIAASSIGRKIGVRKQLIDLFLVAIRA
jgi:hypothetical protein